MTVILLITLFATDPQFRSADQIREAADSGSRDIPTPSEIQTAWQNAWAPVDCIQWKVDITASEPTLAPTDVETLFNGGYFYTAKELVWDLRSGKWKTAKSYWEPTGSNDLTPSKSSISYSAFDGSVVFSRANNRMPDGSTTVTDAHVLATSTSESAAIGEGAIFHECIGSPLSGSFRTYYAEWLLQRNMDSVNETHLPFSLPKALSDREYHVAETLETVDDIRCYVLTADEQDTLWLSTEHNFAIVKRQWRYGEGGSVMFEYRNKQFQQVSEGLWLPRVAERTCMLRSGDSAEQQPHFTTTCKLTEVQINECDDEVYELTYPSGTLLVDGTRSDTLITYRVGATATATQQAIKRALEDLADRR